jgi:hypothetical protein
LVGVLGDRADFGHVLLAEAGCDHIDEPTSKDRQPFAGRDHDGLHVGGEPVSPLDIEVIARRIEKGVTVTKASPFFKSKVAPARNAHKSYIKLEANAAKDRADRARAEMVGRGGRRPRNRPRIRPTK